MTTVEAPLRCLAVSVGFDPSGQIDGLELEAFLDEFAGRSQWLADNERKFAEPPLQAGAWATVAVVLPEAIAALAISADALNDPPRVLHEHTIAYDEAEKWRALNRQCSGRFPWESVDA